MAKALDLLVAVNPAVKNAEIAELKALLDKSRSPRQMLDLWPALLHADAPRELAAAARADAAAVGADADAKTKAKAEVVKALAMVVGEEYGEARATFERVVNRADLMNDAGWAERIQRVHTELTNAKSIATQARRWLDRGDSARASNWPIAA